MAHRLQQPILSPGAGVLTRAPQPIAANTPAASSLRAPAAGCGLRCRAAMLMNNPGSAPAQDGLDRE